VLTLVQLLIHKALASLSREALAGRPGIQLVGQKAWCPSPRDQERASSEVSSMDRRSGRPLSKPIHTISTTLHLSSHLTSR